jgi:retinol dehydrogenase-12
MSGPAVNDVLSLLRSQLCVSLPTPTASFAGETVIVTGANTGLGREAAKHLVRLGASKVILAVRTVSKGEDARKYIEKETNKTGVMEVWPVDMSSTDSIKAFVQKATSLERLDVLVANAGIWPTKHEIVENNEYVPNPSPAPNHPLIYPRATITVNVINTFLLITLLLPILRRTATTYSTIPRVTVVNSALHKFANLKARKSQSIFTALATPPLGPKDYDARYNDSKLLVLLYTRAFAAANPFSNLNANNVVLTSVNPGYCVSALRGENLPLAEKGQRALLARSTDTGAQTLVDAVKPVKGEEAISRHGAYVDDMKVKKPTAWVETKEGRETQERVWRELNEIIAGIEAGAKQ